MPAHFRTDPAFKTDPDGEGQFGHAAFSSTGFAGQSTFGIRVPIRTEIRQFRSGWFAPVSASISPDFTMKSICGAIE